MIPVSVKPKLPLKVTFEVLFLVRVFTVQEPEGMLRATSLVNTRVPEVASISPPDSTRLGMVRVLFPRTKVPPLIPSNFSGLPAGMVKVFPEVLSTLMVA